MDYYLVHPPSRAADTGTEFPPIDPRREAIRTGVNLAVVGLGLAAVAWLPRALARAERWIAHQEDEMDAW
jgi:hypothetical protein